MTQDQVIPLAYFTPFSTNVAIRFSNLAASAGGAIRFQVIRCTDDAVLTTGDVWVLIVWLHRSYLNNHGI